MRRFTYLLAGLLTGLGLPGAAQAPLPARLVTRLYPAPLPPGGLVPFRQGKLWGYADTSRHVVITPRWPAPPGLQLGRYFVRQWHDPAGSYPIDNKSWPLLAVNLRDEALLVPAGQTIELRPDSSLVVTEPGRPGVHYLYANNGSARSDGQPDSVPGGELPYRPWQPFEQAGRYGPLGYGLRIREKELWSRFYFDKYLQPKWYQPEGPKALADARGRRRTGYHYGQLFPFHDGRALVNCGGRHGYLDRRGREVIRPQFGFDTGEFRWQRAIVSDARQPGVAGNQGLIDTLGHFVIPLVPGQQLRQPRLPMRNPARPPLLVRYRQAASVASDGRDLPLPEAQAEFYTYDGQPAFPGQVFTDALPFEAGRAWVQQQGRAGLLDERGHLVAACQYDELEFEHYHGMGPLMLPNGSFGGRWGMNAECSRSLDNWQQRHLRYDSLHLRARRGQLYGYLDRETGREVIPVRYDSVQCTLRRGLAFLRRDGHTYMVAAGGRELAEGAFGRELWRGGRRYLQLLRPGQWCLVDTTGRPVLPWQSAAAELADFDPATGRCLVRRTSAKGDYEYALSGPRGLLTGWQHRRLYFWGPREVLGAIVPPERTYSQVPLVTSYVVYDNQGHQLRTLPGTGFRELYFAEAGLLVLRPYNREPASTLVLDLAAGGVWCELPGFQEAVPYLPPAPGRAAPAPSPACHCYADYRAEPAYRTASRSWPGLLQVTAYPETPRQQLLGYRDARGRQFWED